MCAECTYMQMTSHVMSWILCTPFSQISLSTSMCFMEWERIQGFLLLKGMAFSNFQHYFWAASIHIVTINWLQQTKKNLWVDKALLPKCSYYLFSFWCVKMNPKLFSHSNSGYNLGENWLYHCSIDRSKPSVCLKFGRFNLLGIHWWYFHFIHPVKTEI